MRMFLLLPFLGLCSLAAPPIQRALQSGNALNPYANKPRLTFRRDGTFKITVFSDLHYGENPWDDWGPEQDFNSTRLMNKVLPAEKPDFVVLNGDLITGENTFKENSTSLIDEIVAPLNKFRIPFASSHGNHDNQVNITHLEEILHEQKVAPLSYTRLAPPGVGGEEGPGNYWVPVYAKASDRVPALVLWFFDSRGGVSQKDGSVLVPDWVDSSVATWIEHETSLMNAHWGPPGKRGSLAFVHIPPRVVEDVQKTLNSTENPGLNADLLDGDGSVQSTYDGKHIGEDEPFYDAVTKNLKNLHAIISGHDHGNEWCAREPTKKVIFCFSKHSGYGGYGVPEWGYGVRNIVFRSPDPTSQPGQPETWIRLEDGETRAHVVLNDRYLR